MPGILMSYWGEKYQEEKQKVENGRKKSETPRKQFISKDK
jgi:hypothetical protein